MQISSERPIPTSSSASNKTTWYVTSYITDFTNMPVVHVLLQLFVGLFVCLLVCLHGFLLSKTHSNTLLSLSNIISDSFDYFYCIASIPSFLPSFVVSFSFFPTFSSSATRTTERRFLRPSRANETPSGTRPLPLMSTPSTTWSCP